MSERLTRFLIDLSKDPDRMEEFSRDPDLVLAGYDLTEEEKRIAKSGDRERIRLHIGESLPRYAQQSMWAPKPPPPPPPPPRKKPKKPRPEPTPEEPEPEKPKRKPAKRKPPAGATAPA